VSESRGVASAMYKVQSCGVPIIGLAMKVRDSHRAYIFVTDEKILSCGQLVENALLFERVCIMGKFCNPESVIKELYSSHTHASRLLVSILYTPWINKWLLEVPKSMAYEVSHSPLQHLDRAVLVSLRLQQFYLHRREFHIVDQGHVLEVVHGLHSPRLSSRRMEALGTRQVPYSI
jgi:hypothetical protein